MVVSKELERNLSATLRIHKLATHSLAACVATCFALPGGSALVSMFSVSEDAGGPRGGVSGHEFAVLGEAEKGLVSVVIATEGSDNALVKVLEEAFGLTILLDIRIAFRCWSAHIRQGRSTSHRRHECIIIEVAHIVFIGGSIAKIDEIIHIESRLWVIFVVLFKGAVNCKVARGVECFRGAHDLTPGSKVVSEGRHHEIGAGSQHGAEVGLVRGCEGIRITLVNQLQSGLARTVVGCARHAVGCRIQPIMTGGSIGRDYDKMLSGTVYQGYRLVRVRHERAHDWATTAGDSIALIIGSDQRVSRVSTKKGARVSNSGGRRKVLICCVAMIG